jgi:integrase
MNPARTRAADATKILTRCELAAVLADLKRKAPRSPGTRLNLVLFRLACCSGLRASEIASLQMHDVRVGIWWDAGTLADITAWHIERTGDGAICAAPFIDSHRPGA